MLMRAATVVQQVCKSCRTCFKFYCMFYFTCDCPSLHPARPPPSLTHIEPIDRSLESKETHIQSHNRCQLFQSTHYSGSCSGASTRWLRLVWNSDGINFWVDEVWGSLVSDTSWTEPGAWCLHADVLWDSPAADSSWMAAAGWCWRM